jgi:flagellar biosynthesis/type III secretory pathway protein FliH
MASQQLREDTENLMNNERMIALLKCHVPNKVACQVLADSLLGECEDQLEAQRSKIENEAYDAGYEDGKSDGHGDGWQEGWDEGYEVGMEEGAQNPYC